VVTISNTNEVSLFHINNQIFELDDNKR